MGSTVRSLSIHADYRCRHSGECCSIDWDVPIEVPIYRSLTEAVAAGRVTPATPTDAPFTVGDDMPDGTGAFFARTSEGRCVFFEAGSRLCVVHRDLGEPALPLTCRHFPRVSIQDARGTHVALSHFCPTAASMLFRDDVPVRIVEGPPAFPGTEYDGLVVAAEEFPPLLHPSMLMDHASYAAWEAHMVARCAELSRSPESILATLARDATVVRAWTPGKESLSETIASLPGDYVAAAAAETIDASLDLYFEVMTAVPDELRPEPDEHGLDVAFADYVRPEWARFTAPLDRYLAAKSFASWTSYQGRGVASIVRGLEAALALVRVEAARQCRDAGRPLDADLLLEAIRFADFSLNHLAVGDELAMNWAAVERG